LPHAEHQLQGQGSPLITRIRGFCCSHRKLLAAER